MALQQIEGDSTQGLTYRIPVVSYVSWERGANENRSGLLHRFNPSPQKMPLFQNALRDIYEAATLTLQVVALQT